MNDETQALRLERVAIHRGIHCFCILEGGSVVFASAEFSASFGLVAGQPVEACPAIVAPRDLTRVQAAFTRVRATGGEIRVDFTARRRSGLCFQATATIARIDTYGEQPLLLAIDETPEPADTVRELTVLAFNDSLTGLSNRARLLDDLRAMILRCRRQGGMVGLLIADLDGLKLVNDRYGHGAGDRMLVRAARCMEEAVREGDVVARLGGDEFAVVLPRLSGIEDAAVVAGRLISGLAKSNRAHPASMSVGVSVGVAVWPTHGDSIDDVFASADRAMYRAKRGGKNRYCIADAAGAADNPQPIRFFDWGSDRDLGVKSMDDDHRAMAALINRLGDELKSGRDEERLNTCMNQLVMRTAGHFAREERWMERHEYAHRAIHKAEHERLLEDLMGLGMRIDSRSMVLTMRYLQDWLCRHVDDSDRELARTALSMQRVAQAPADMPEGSGAAAHLPATSEPDDADVLEQR